MTDRETNPTCVRVFTSKDGINWIPGIDPDWTYLWAQSESVVGERKVPLSERGFMSDVAGAG